MIYECYYQFVFQLIIELLIYIIVLNSIIASKLVNKNLFEVCILNVAQMTGLKNIYKKFNKYLNLKIKRDWI